MICPPPRKIASAANVTSIILNLLLRIAIRMGQNSEHHSDGFVSESTQLEYARELDIGKRIFGVLEATYVLHRAALLGLPN